MSVGPSLAMSVQTDMARSDRRTWLDLRRTWLDRYASDPDQEYKSLYGRKLFLSKIPSVLESAVGNSSFYLWDRKRLLLGNQEYIYFIGRKGFLLPIISIPVTRSVKRQKEAFPSTKYTYSWYPYSIYILDQDLYIFLIRILAESI